MYIYMFLIIYGTNIMESKLSNILSLRRWLSAMAFKIQIKCDLYN